MNLYSSVMRRRATLTALLSLTIGLALIAPAWSALCVWLRPDRDIKRFFPGADAYATEVRRQTRAQHQTIERRLGRPLDQDETEFRFYRVTKGGSRVGTVLTHQTRGRFGPVQVVVAIGLDHKIVGIFVQLDREPVNLNQDWFLKQFEGKTVRDPLELGKDLRPIQGHERSSEAVSFSVRKLLIVYDVLNQPN